MLCPVRDLNPWPPASNSNLTYSKAKMCSCIASCATYLSCITNYTFQDLLHTTNVYAVIYIFFFFSELVLTWQIWTCFWQVYHYRTTHKMLNQRMWTGLRKINTSVINTWLTHHKKGNVRVCGRSCYRTSPVATCDMYPLILHAKPVISHRVYLWISYAKWNTINNINIINRLVRVIQRYRILYIQLRISSRHYGWPRRLLHDELKELHLTLTHARTHTHTHTHDTNYNLTAKNTRLISITKLSYHICNDVLQPVEPIKYTLGGERGEK